MSEKQLSDAEKDVQKLTIEQIREIRYRIDEEEKVVKEEIDSKRSWIKGIEEDLTDAEIQKNKELAKKLKKTLETQSKHFIVLEKDLLNLQKLKAIYTLSPKQKRTLALFDGWVKRMAKKHGSFIPIFGWKHPKITMENAKRWQEEAQQTKEKEEKEMARKKKHREYLTQQKKEAAEKQKLLAEFKTWVQAMMETRRKGDIPIFRYSPAITVENALRWQKDWPAIQTKEKKGAVVLKKTMTSEEKALLTAFHRWVQDMVAEHGHKIPIFGRRPQITLDNARRWKRETRKSKPR